jgi:hypothetical protein
MGRRRIVDPSDSTRSCRFMLAFPNPPQPPAERTFQQSSAARQGRSNPRSSARSFTTAPRAAVPDPAFMPGPPASRGPAERNVSPQSAGMPRPKQPAADGTEARSMPSPVRQSGHADPQSKHGHEVETMPRFPQVPQSAVATAVLDGNALSGYAKDPTHLS